MPTVSQRDDIKSLIERVAGIKVVGSANVRGVREYHSNCPFCGGTDRFITRPETGQYTCATRSSGCGRHGDGIDFLREYSNMSMDEAIRELALEDVSFYKNKPERTHGLDEPPPKAWQDAACALIARATDCLWHSAEGAQALAYLHGRGLSDSILKKMYIGYVPLMPDGRWYSASFESWGLDPTKLSPAQYAKGCVRVPNGILIPWFEGTTIWKLAIKRPGEEMDYGQVLGSAEGLYNISSVQYEKPSMLVEGEFDALSVMQEAGDLVSVVATGSAARGRSPRWTAELSQASFLIQAFDDDEGGERGAEHWLSVYEKCFRFQPMFYKDPNDMLKNLSGEELRNWVLWALYTWENAQRLDNLPESVPLARVRYPEIAHCAIEITPSEQAIRITEYEPSAEDMQAYEDELVKPKYDGLGVVLSERETQAEFERLCISDRVQTPQGMGTFWDSKQLREHVERGFVRVTLDSGGTKLFAPHDLEPVLELVNLSF